MIARVSQTIERLADERMRMARSALHSVTAAQRAADPELEAAYQKARSSYAMAREHNSVGRYFRVLWLSQHAYNQLRYYRP